MIAFILCTVLLFNVSAPVDDKIRVEDVVLKHLEASEPSRGGGRAGAGLSRVVR